jgi:hypothetical protein
MFLILEAEPTSEVLSLEDQLKELKLLLEINMQQTSSYKPNTLQNPSSA